MPSFRKSLRPSQVTRGALICCLWFSSSSFFLFFLSALTGEVQEGMDFGDPLHENFAYLTSWLVEAKWMPRSDFFKLGSLGCHHLTGPHRIRGPQIRFLFPPTCDNPLKNKNNIIYDYLLFFRHRDLIHVSIWCIWCWDVDLEMIFWRSERLDHDRAGFRWKVENSI